jgi:hypothetical protein
MSRQCPRRKASIGRATWPTPYVASEATMRLSGCLTERRSETEEIPVRRRKHR